MPRPPFWVFSLVGFLFFSFLFFFFFLVFNLLIEWTFGEIFPSLFFSTYWFLVIWMHSLDFFLASICLHISILDESFPFSMKSLLDEPCIPLGMMNFRFFKLDAHFAFSHIDGISFIFPWLSESSSFFDDLLSLA